MKTTPDNQWLEQFQLVRVTRQIEEEIIHHQHDMESAPNHETDWDSALVDWTIHSAHNIAVIQ